ncbi:MAG: hypothetical protein H6738_06635 [Alphaproteobacteria bacterium]|nr:hypothetical protein [Alphaproteobacteria bacterium]MCB9696438.1 hypothetical protein [Alphaproteobacteria bacterium]
MSLCWWVAGALAGPAAPVVEPEPDPAEYRRLSVELEALAARNAWAGVERTFQELLATGVEPSYGDWMRGAESARLSGDIQEVYLRLMSAKDRSDDNRTAVDWLWDLDHRYGTVFLACDAGSNIVLEAEQIPFDPDQARAIAFAQERVRTSCLYQGRLPGGVYHFYTHTIEVEPLLQSTYVDLRGTSIPRSRRRELKRAWAEQDQAATSDGS